MTRDQIEALVTRYLHARLDAAEEALLEPRLDDRDELGISPGLEVWEERLGEQIEATEEAIRSNHFQSVEGLAREMLKGSPEEMPEALFRTFCRRLLETRKEALWAELRALQGGNLAPRGAPAAVPEVAPEVKPKHTPALSEVIKGYDADQISTWRPRSAQMAREGLSFFIGVVGDKQIGEVTPSDLRDYRSALRARPGKRGGSLSPSTITKHQSYVTGLFKWAADGEVIENNPAPRILKPEKSGVSDDEQREAFTDAELRLIFGGAFGDNKTTAPERYWVPLLMLYTGARNEEIAQLYVADVKEVDGVHCIDINADTPDKSLKNKFSKRKTPIHSELLSLGFLEYVESIRKEGHPRLWPNLHKTKRGYNAPLSVWFNRWLEKVGVKSARKDSYSLRHTFSTRLKEQGVAEYLIDQLTGHKTEGMSAGRYGKKVDLPLLRGVVDTARITSCFLREVAQ